MPRFAATDDGPEIYVPPPLGYRATIAPIGEATGVLALMLVLAVIAVPPLRAQTADSQTVGATSGSGTRQLFSYPGVIGLGKFRVPIVDAGRMDGELVMVLAVTPKTAADLDQLKVDGPLIRAAVLPVLLDFAQTHASPRLAVDAALLSRQLDVAARNAMASVGKVLILEVRAVPMASRDDPR